MHQNYDAGYREDTSKKNGWSASGTLTRLETSKSVSLQVVFPDSGPYTVQFFLSPQEAQVGSGNPTTCEATLEWSVEGNTIRRVVTVTDGLSISGTGQGVRVVAKDTTTSGGGTTAADYTVVIAVAPGTRPGTQIAPTLLRLAQTVNIPNAGNVSVAIPDSVGISAVCVMISSGPAGSAPIPDQSVQAQHSNAAATTFMTYDPRTFQWVPLTPGATAIRLTNINAFVVTATIIFEIDG